MAQTGHLDPPQVSSEEFEARASLVLSLRRRGVNDRRVLSAIERVPRRLFLAARLHRYAYEDCLLPIECGQVVSAPSLVARMAEALEIQPSHRVLEIGTGSGYQTAILSQLCQHVFTVERYQTLISLARQRLAALKITNCELHHADGLQGLRERAPFDRIVLTGAVTSIPQILKAQLASDGILVCPIGAPGTLQALVRFRKGAESHVEESLGELRLVSLRPGKADFL
ncbi:protein-L-isoaspartate(D-aspartate) O-methyltransferase [Microvirga tunisiensis]|uniref:Protein-L-isoaspartate O-methyltransferase n=2 Tax=Pannonibacter tanglangensis TaxID=2750084 RepID=A0A7X5F166_9HYPH|nr:MULTISPECIES: protein-L-isoaspartate(D-aspartate) O-methyltransferase [unclassified Pannonibacter]NBN62219.1 protein-L-isoaspartate(D-aspartate) O-methyltransferase [Pannonibacter sp. XCT-34]NBN77885.1 protein-L-isoaspartate(D-aspartate) O-methyltransferase [Pannonibacter sp. XCT-53]